MSKKAKRCEKCVHFDPEGFSIPLENVDDTIDPQRLTLKDRLRFDVCELGNRPKFFHAWYPARNDFGWKRRCNDFETREERER